MDRLCEKLAGLEDYQPLHIDDLLFTQEEFDSFQLAHVFDYYNLFKGKEVARMLKAIHNISTRQYSLPLAGT
jgi:hypothetical protein